MSERNPLILEWTERAAEDMEAIADYLLGGGLSCESVEEYVKRLFKAPGHFAALPGAGRPGRVPNTREWLVRGTPYALIYDVKGGKIRILRVMHGSRQFPEQQGNFTLM